MPTITLTDLAVKALKPMAGKRVTYIDKTLKGFGVRVTETGDKTFVLTYGPDRKRVKLGDVGIVKLADARQRAKDILAGYQLNGEAAPSITFEEALDLFLKLHCSQLRESTSKENERLLRRHFLPSLSDTPVRKIETADLIGVVDRLFDTPSEANHAFTAAKTLFRFLVARQHLSHSPLEALRKPAKASSRDRVLTDAELHSVLNVARDGGRYGRLVELLLLTGQRVGQIVQLRAEWLDTKESLIRFPAEVMKGKEDHVLPYPARAAEILDALPQEGLLFPTEGDPVIPFNNWSNSHTAFLKAAKVAHFTRHDCRRTTSTNLARLGVGPHIVEAILAHAAGTISPVGRIYNRYRYLPEMKAALDLHAEWLQNLPKPA